MFDLCLAQWHPCTMKMTVSVMVTLLASSVVDCRFNPWSGQTKDYKTGSFNFFVKETDQVKPKTIGLVVLASLLKRQHWVITNNSTSCLSRDDVSQMSVICLWTVIVGVTLNFLVQSKISECILLGVFFGFCWPFRLSLY